MQEPAHRGHVLHGESGYEWETFKDERTCKQILREEAARRGYPYSARSAWTRHPQLRVRGGDRMQASGATSAHRGHVLHALKYAGPEYEWETFKDDSRTCKQILREEAARDEPGLPLNPLSRIALTNFYKWVAQDREGRRGGADRRHFNRCLEIKLFQAEVHTLKPDVVVFQSASFKSKFKKILGPGAVASSYILKDPSYRGSRQPKEIVRPVAQHPPA